MDNKEQITTRTYKIKAIVIGILAVMVYIASQDVICRGWFLPPNTIT